MVSLTIKFVTLICSLRFSPLIIVCIHCYLGAKTTISLLGLEDMSMSYQAVLLIYISSRTL